MYAVRMNRKARSRQGGADLSIRERAYLHIQQLLLSGKLEAGSSVSEQMLAKDLGSSRTPIREAMNQLAAEGLLEPSPNGGMIVTQLGREDIIELYELREALEVYAVGKDAGFEPLRAWFSALYEVLLGQSQGPRFGSFVELYGIAETRALMARQLGLENGGKATAEDKPKSKAAPKKAASAGA